MSTKRVCFWKGRLDVRAQQDYIVNMLNQKIDLTNRVPLRAKETVEIPPSAFDERHDTVLYWLGGGGFLMNSRGTIVMVDPVIEMDRDTMTSETGHKMLIPFPISANRVDHVDCVLYTHPDLDHVGPTTSRILARKRVRRLAPQRVALNLLEHGVKLDDITTCRKGDHHQVNDVRIEVIEADHPWQLIDREKHGKPLRGDDACGFVVRTPDGTFLFTGDTRLLESHLDISDVDVILVDTAKCAFHLNVEGAIILCSAYPSAFLIPYHYGVFDEPTIPAQEQGNPEDVFRCVPNADRRAFVLAPGEPFILENRSQKTI